MKIVKLGNLMDDDGKETVKKYVRHCCITLLIKINQREL